MASATTATPREVATAVFESLNRHDLDAAMALDHADVVGDFVAVGVFTGVSAVRAFFAEIFAAMPDFTLEVLRLVCDDEHAVVQWRATGTFTGASFQGIHATGRHVMLRGVDVMRVEQGRLKHNTIYYDGLGFARQIGMLPSEGSLPDKAMTTTFNARTDLIRMLRRN
jgi:steroid delta-isomerase-like uncharacterized protein